MDVSLKQQVREPNAVIGGRIRAARALRGISQERLGEALGLTFQQAQKYENGKNRVSACTLVAIAKLLNVEIDFFFPSSVGAPGAGEIALARRDVAAALAAVDDALSTLAPLRDRLAEADQRLRAAESGRAAL